jgi:hypothetical protein
MIPRAAQFGSRLLRAQRAGQGVQKSVVRKNHWGWDEGNVATPPTNYVPLWEKVAHLCFMMGGILSFPTYVVANLDKWRGGPVEYR